MADLELGRGTLTRVLVISDTHGEIAKIEDVLKKESGNYDICFHLGDRSWDMRPFRSSIERLVQVKGNIEADMQGPTEFGYEYINSIEGLRVMAAHGHQYSVHFTMSFIRKAAQKKNIGLVLYGHTHLKDYTEDEGIVYFNPGALKSSEYGFLCIDKGRVVQYRHSAV